MVRVSICTKRAFGAMVALVVMVVMVRAVGVLGDTFQLRDGTVITGKYAGGSATAVQVETGQGVQSIETARILSITFSETPAAGPAAAPKPSAAAPVTVPAGSVLTVRMETQVASTDAAGRKFTAKLLADLNAGPTTVAKAGTTVFGEVEQSKQAGRLAGKSELALTLTGIDFGGKVQPILTTNFAEAGKGEFRNTARSVTRGALIGNAIDDSGGAGKGAAVGAGVALIKKGDSVTVPAGAIVEFRLTQAFQLNPG